MKYIKHLKIITKEIKEQNSSFFNAKNDIIKIGDTMKKGFTLIELLSVIIILGIILAIAIPTITNVMNTSKIETYKNNVEKLMIKVDEYISENISVLPTSIGETKEISLIELKENNYIKELKSPFNNDSCSGYILVTKTELDYELIPHINCYENINNSIEDKLVLHYTFDEFQEPTINLASNTTITGHGSSYLLQDFKYDNGDVFKNLVTNPNTGNNFGFRSFNISNLNASGYKNLTISFDNKINVSPGTMKGYARINYTDGTNTNHNWSYNPSNWFLEDNDFKKVAATVNFTTSKIPNQLTTWYVYKDNASEGDMYISNIQIEQKPYATPFVNGSRNGTVYDLSINSNHSNLSLTTTPRWIFDEERNTGVYSFNNSNINRQFNMSNTITISLWSKILDNTKSIQTLFAIGGTAAEISIISGRLWTGFIINSVREATYVSENVLFDNNWHLISLTYDENKIISYIDGEKVNERVFPGTLSTSLLPLFIGNMSASSTYNTIGLIDNVRIYNRALSEDEIKTLYNISK